MSQAEATQVVKQYVHALKMRKFPFSAVYLYGSHAKESSHEWSDIDVCVVSDRFAGKKWHEHSVTLLELVEDIDFRIEPYGMSAEVFESISPLAHEIRTTGIRVV